MFDIKYGGNTKLTGFWLPLVYHWCATTLVELLETKVVSPTRALWCDLSLNGVRFAWQCLFSNTKCRAPVARRPTENNSGNESATNLAACQKGEILGTLITPHPPFDRSKFHNFSPTYFSLIHSERQTFETRSARAIDLDLDTWPSAGVGGSCMEIFSTETGIDGKSKLPDVVNDSRLFMISP